MVRKAQTPPPEPKPTDLIRVAINPDDYVRLLDYLAEWDDPLAHRLRMRYSQYRLKHPM